MLATQHLVGTLMNTDSRLKYITHTSEAFHNPTLQPYAITTGYAGCLRWIVELS